MKNRQTASRWKSKAGSGLLKGRRLDVGVQLDVVMVTEFHNGVGSDERKQEASAELIETHNCWNVDTFHNMVMKMMMMIPEELSFNGSSLH